jgi:hypothetical protein
VRGPKRIHAHGENGIRLGFGTHYVGKVDHAIDGLRVTKSGSDLRLVSHIALHHVHLAGIAGRERGTIEANH